MYRCIGRNSVFLAAFFAVTALSAVAGEESGDVVELHYFWGDGCPVCARQDIFLDELNEEHEALSISRYEVWYDEGNLELLRAIATELGFEVRGVPVTVIGDRHWTGFNDQIARAIEAEVARAIRSAEVGEEADVSSVSLPFFGEIVLTDAPLLVSTLLIAFIDGFNPCSLWVLTMLLALVVYTRSRVRTLLVGVTFLSVTALVYGAFIAGVFGVFGAIAHQASVRAVAAVLALTFGALSVHDYFSFGGRYSLTISDSKKAGIASRIGSLVRGERSTLAMVAMTAALAFSVAIVELPCTAGFPVIWSGLVAERAVDGSLFAGLLILYIFVYLLIELAVFAVAFFGLSARRIDADYARIVKLFGGLVMLALAAGLMFAPEALYSFERSLALFGAAIAAGAAIRVVHRRMTG